MSEAKCEPPGHVFTDGEQICNCRNAMRPKPPEKIAEEIMAWLAGLVCQVCGGTGRRPGVPDFEGSREVSTQSECDCHGTGRLLWRLVRPCTWCSKGGVEIEGQVVPRGTVTSGRVDDDGHIIWVPHESCGGTRLVTREPILGTLIDTALDLGFATVFTPDEWDEHLPAAWITVRSSHKIFDLLHALVALVERRPLHGLEP